MAIALQSSAGEAQGSGDFVLFQPSCDAMAGQPIAGTSDCELIGMAAAECSHKDAAGAATGFVGLFAYLGASLSGWPLARVIDVWHWSGFFAVIAIAAGISALLLLPFLHAQAPREAHEA